MPAPPLAREELVVKQQELNVRRIEANKALATVNAPWWRSTDPIMLALLGAILTLIGNMAVGYFNNAASVAQERRKAENDLALEKQKAKYTLILQAMATNDVKAAERNINFFIGAGLLEDSDKKIQRALSMFKPVLPAPGGGPSAGPTAVAATDIARLYNFPPELDGAGQTLGILAFGGGFQPADLDAAFARLHLERPSVTAVEVAGARNAPGDSGVDAQVLTDLQITGAIAPQARLRVYFSPFSADGWTQTLARAAADGVGVLLIGWGQTESRWTPAELHAVNDALGNAARAGITLVVAAGDHGVTDGESDKRRHVNFPASSPWVLAVGGTSLKRRGGRVVSETAWKTGTSATGGGVSDIFERPSWQAALQTPARADGQFGRSVPDVAATAWDTMAAVMVRGQMVSIGGTTVSAGIWAGLVTLMNQGLGRNLGYFNPRLYGEVGPAGVLRAIEAGDNGIDGVEGFKAGPGWNPVAGWGSPDGGKLIEWLRRHP